jgi:hypothetical protein
MSKEASEIELLRRVADARALDIRTSCAGVVVSFDANTWTATIRPGVRVQATDSDSSPEVDTLADLEGVPVEFPHWGPAVLYHPLSPGDVGRLEFSEEDDGEIYVDPNAAVPVNPLVLRKHGASCVFRPGGRRGAASGDAAGAAGFLGRPGGVGIAFDAASLRLGASNASDPVALNSLVKAAVAAAIAGHTHSGVTTGPGITGNGVLAGAVLEVGATKVMGV